MKEGFAVPGMQPQPPAGPAPASAPPAAPADPPKPLSPEELQAGAKDLYKTLFQDENPPEDLFKKPEAAPVEAPAAPAAEAPPAPEPAPAAPPAQPPPPAPQPPKLTTREIISQTAREVGERVAEAVRPTAEPAAQPQPEPVPELIADDAEDLKAIQFLEETQPGKYAGKAQEFLNYVQAHYAYQEKWLAEHPGEVYDANAQEHQQWYEDNQPEIQAKEVDKAKVQLQVQEGVQQAYERDIAPKVREMDQEKAFQKALPKIGANVDARKLAIVEAAAPELAALLKDANGRANITSETIAKVDEADPFASKILGNLVSAAHPILLELEKVAEANLRLTPATNPVHAEIDRYRAQAE